jgi:membrane protease subunit HflC
VRRALIIAAAAVFVIALLARAMTYTVRFTENGVLTTFGRADPDSSIKKDPGLYFKWPDPIQSVTKYDTRARFLQTKLETQQTADSRQLTVESFCTWKVDNPLKFFQKFSNKGARTEDHYEGAKEVLRGALRTAMGEISRYRMDDLFTASAPSKLPELEKQILVTLQQSTGDGNRISDFGIRVESVGINAVALPEETTKAVFESMKQDRARLVSELQSKGEAEASRIRSSAEANAKRIEKFAEAYAAEIRQKGDEEATAFIAQMAEAPELAVFLKQIDFIRSALAKRVTWIVDTTTPAFELMAPAAIRKAQNGEVPGVRALMGEGPPVRQAEGEQNQAKPASGGNR